MCACEREIEVFYLSDGNLNPRQKKGVQDSEEMDVILLRKKQGWR